MNNRENDLIRLAKEAMTYAYAPYSRFQVGACLLAEDGTTYTGCNMENASYGATICAERVVIGKAVSEGRHSFQAIAIVCSEGRKAYPCGICLQVISEFMPPEGIVILEDAAGTTEYQVKDLIPNAFRLGEIDT